jgi:hypothetical protein
MMHKQIVRAIAGLTWENLSTTELQELMVLSAYAAREFAESLRIALEIYPKSIEFQEMALGEINTENLKFGGYKKSGDHADFLWHFINKHRLADLYPDAQRAGERYLAQVQGLPKEVRAMSVVSRERELPGIFRRVLEAKDWSAQGLDAFRYYLAEHIHLDSMEGGHGDLLAGFGVTEEVGAFYQIRMDMYRCIPNLFE